MKILTVGKKGREQLRRDMGKLLVGHVDLSAVKRLGYTEAQGIAHDVMHRYNAGEFDVCTIFYNRFQSVISQIPTAQQLIPAIFDEEPAPPSPSTSTSPTRRRSSPSCCRAASPPTSSPRCSRTAPPSRARA